MPTRTTTRLVHEVVDAIWGRGELERADQLFAPDYTNHGGLIPNLVHGPEAVKVAVALYRLAFPHLRIAVEDVVVDGERVTFRWVADNGDGPAGGGTTRPDAPARAGLAGGMVLRIVAGQIAESWTSWDAEGVLQRLGVVRASGEPGSTFAA